MFQPPEIDRAGGWLGHSDLFHTNTIQGGKTMSETRTANGDLTFAPRPTDSLTQARDNLRYWEDRVNRGLAHPHTVDTHQVPALMAAVRLMIETIDKEVLA